MQQDNEDIDPSSLLETIIRCREEIPVYIAESLQRFQDKTLDNLRKIDFEKIIKNQENPELEIKVEDSGVEDLHNDTMEHNIPELKEQLKLIEILNRKRRCPISQIVDKV